MFGGTRNGTLNSEWCRSGRSQICAADVEGGRYVPQMWKEADMCRSHVRSWNFLENLSRELLSFGTEYFVFQLNLNIKIHRTISLPVVLYGCLTWSLTLREARRLRLFNLLAPELFF